MPETTIADSGPLIALSRIGRLYLLPRLFQKILIPPEVWNEVTVQGGALPGASEIKSAPWIEIQAPGPLLVTPLSILVDPGEAEAIALAQENPDSILLLDDSQARKVARRLKLQITGTIGLLLRAKRKGLIEHVRPCFEDLQKNGIHIRQKLIEAALTAAGEIQ